MVLKSLVLQGFKSFPDKTEIRFLGGMTAIVGPNGSGKSNISDAIRWVLGEQSSRSLRGAKMEDVIFGGTAKRNPLGFAEVSLILDNAGQRFRSDFTEIMITRRYYRSGESEYFLNKNHCRLKDVHELFMDTGLGRDGYSMIGQGRIDEILSLKSEDRREVFEEAAGITKFRYRKEEAERKLAATEENLVRIRDLHTELERQVGPLEKQAEKAKTYLKLRDELRVLEVSLWLLKLVELGKTKEKNDHDSVICAQQLSAVQEGQRSLYEQSEQLAQDLRAADADLERLRSDMHEAEQQAADRAGKCAVLRANIKNNEENIDRVRLDSVRQKEQQQSLGQQTDERVSRLRVLDAEYEGITVRLGALAQTAQQLLDEQNEAAAQVSEAEQSRQFIAERGFALELERTAAQAGLDSMDERRDTIARDVAESAEKLKEEQERQSIFREELALCLDTLASAKNKLAGVSLKAENRRKKVEEWDSDYAQAGQKLADCDNRIRMLRDMQREYDGFSRSVKSVMTAAEKGLLSGVHGPVSMLLTVPDAYVTAIDTALGAAASNLVVDCAEDGKAAISYLKRCDGGRATFLPLDTIRGASLKENGLSARQGCFGTAEELVSCDAKYRAVVQSLLGRTVVVQDMDAALVLAKAYSNRFRIVTLDGQIIQAGGAMTGGSVSKGTGALARAGKLRQLEEQRKTLAQTVDETENRLTAAKKELSALDYDLKAIEAERARAQEDEARLTAQASQHLALVESLQTRHDGLLLERDNLAGAKDGYLTAIAEKTDEIARIDAQLAAAEQDIAKKRSALDKITAECVQNTADCAEAQTALAENRTEVAAEQRAVEDLKAIEQHLTDGLADATNTISGFTAEIERLRAELVQQEQEREHNGGRTEQIRALIAAKAEQRLRIEGDKTKADKASQGKNEEILQLERETARLDNRSVQLKNEETQILDKMWESYELTPTPAQEYAVPLENPAESGRQASTLREQMRALGNINLDAIEEYKTTAERFIFLGEQKKDLEQAQGELYKVINRLTEEMKEVFATEFAKLNAYFGETFREIFGGGHAELQLADTSDILNCGIEIRVSPPGKSVRTITLLSGGEKAFVAIALYFAILKLRPTPFCVLDEIEAALDDVNVARYAHYIRRLCDNTQFICITHRRGTMEESDMLYGVTMQEQGVSKLLMLNLAEAEKHLGKELK